MMHFITESGKVKNHVEEASYVFLTAPLLLEFLKIITVVVVDVMPFSKMVHIIKATSQKIFCLVMGYLSVKLWNTVEIGLIIYLMGRACKISLTEIVILEIFKMDSSMAQILCLYGIIIPFISNIEVTLSKEKFVGKVHSHSRRIILL